MHAGSNLTEESLTMCSDFILILVNTDDELDSSRRSSANRRAILFQIPQPGRAFNFMNSQCRQLNWRDCGSRNCVTMVTSSILSTKRERERQFYLESGYSGSAVVVLSVNP